MQKPCANCHTMHNSQNYDPMGNAARQEALMNDSCVGCHTQTSGIGFDDGGTIKPFVWTIADPGYNEMSVTTQPTLAGGNFHWVAGGADLKGHNVAGIVPQTSRTPPGGTQDITSLTCAGETDTVTGVAGCHGNGVGSQVESISGSHHSNVAIDGGATLEGSYRMLNGIDGREDPDWEYTLAAADRNQYKGVRRSNETGPGNNEISAFCARCHGNFHNDSGGTGTAGASFSSPWIRHPVDIDIGDSPEYQYGGATAEFQVQTPLGSESFPVSPNPPPDTLDLSGTNGEGIIT
ncbi:MAG: hypothetical protein LC633_10265, partial [Desulfobulbaceae bacterium]|nr:hypothetical protein [Desulfobulbaceae bacterium]